MLYFASSLSVHMLVVLGKPEQRGPHSQLWSRWDLEHPGRTLFTKPLFFTLVTTWGWGVELRKGSG
jgi:hypothetical protein